MPELRRANPVGSHRQRQALPVQRRRHQPLRDVPAGKDVDETVAIALTSRQLEVLRLVWEGKTHDEIARLLVCSPRTINNHVKAVFDRLAVNNSISACRLALKYGWLEADEHSHTPVLICEECGARLNSRNA